VFLYYWWFLVLVFGFGLVWFGLVLVGYMVMVGALP
jgi:hypothetical protein